MPGSPTNRTFKRALALVCFTATLSGCASWQLPRIDPSGERILVWPNQPPPAVVGPPIGTAVIAPQSAAPLVPPPVVGPPFGNVQAPPVYSDPPAAPITPVPVAVPPVITTPAPPVINAPAAPVIAVPAPPTAMLPAALPITPVVPVGTPNVATPLGVVAPAGVDHLRVTPGGVLAPVGSEVVLKAGICGADGYLHTNQRVHWTLSGSSVGQFGDLGGREPHYSFGWWSAARLIDPFNATGSTAHSPIHLTRGTPDPNDDVDIVRGDAWVTVTSTAEGTSYVTAYAPGISRLNRAVSTIYWVDAQWTFPSSAVVEPGRPHVLTTTVMRRTDGAPLAGWLVRYDVASGASLGYEGGNSVEVPTDANGRASVEVSPMSPGGGATQVGVTIVRPAVGPPNAAPRFEVGRASATITWGAAAPIPSSSEPITPAPVSPPTSPGPYAPPPVIPPAPQSEPRPSLPTGPPPIEPYTPPVDEPSAGRPQLELQLRRSGPEQVGVGEVVRFEVTITNRGPGTARGIRLRDRFDTGLRHPSAKPNEFAVEYPGVRDLPPGESTTIPLTFQVVAGGTQCHEVTVSVEGAESISERACVTARQGALEVEVTAPRSRVVGEVAQFNVVVKNVGDVAATNVEIIHRYDEALDPSEAPEGHERLADGGILLRIDRLEAGERRSIRTTALCRTPSNRACNSARVTADGGIVAAAEGCVEILPTLSAGPDAADRSPIRITVSENKNPTRVGERQIIYVNVQNASQEMKRQVSVRVLLPQEFTADPAQIQPQQGLTVVGQEFRFAVGELPAQQQFRVTVPVTANRAGSIQVRAAAVAAGMTAPVTADSKLIEILSASL